MFFARQPGCLPAAGIAKHVRQQYGAILVACGDNPYASEWLTAADRVVATAANARELKRSTLEAERIRGSNGTLVASVGALSLPTVLHGHPSFSLPDLEQGPYVQAESEAKFATLDHQPTAQAFTTLLHGLLQEPEQDVETVSGVALKGDPVTTEKEYSLMANNDWILQDQETEESADDHIKSVRSTLDGEQTYDELLGSNEQLYGEPNEDSGDYAGQSLSDLYGQSVNQAGVGGLNQHQTKMVIIGIVAALVVLAIMILFGFNPISAIAGGSDEPAQPETATQNPEPSGSGAAGSEAEGSSVSLPAAQIPLHDSGVTFKPPVEEDDTYLLAAGDVSWGGEITTGENGETLTLEGPTAAQIKRSLTFKDGSISTGVFGRTAPEKPLQHATSHRLMLTGDEKTSGTFFEVDGTELVSMGAYFDYRDGDEITRTYVEMDPESADGGVKDVYATTFDSPLAKNKNGQPATDEGPPIPTLVALHENDSKKGEN